MNNSDFLYNVKIISYPNGSTQIRFYKNFCHGSEKNDKCIDTTLDSLTDNVLLSDFVINNDNLRSFTSSLNRSKNAIMQYARANKWDIFVTLTFNTKTDRTDYDRLLKMLRVWLSNLKARKCPDLAYIIVPEEHKRTEKNGKHAYHFHGLFGNIDGLSLSPAYSPNGTPLYSSNGLRIYNIADYKLGFSTATYVTDTFKCSTYIIKYITKALCIRQKNKHRYLASNNLNKPTVYNLSLFGDDDIYKYYAVSFEKTVNVKCGTFEDTVTYLEVDKLDNSLSTEDIVNDLMNLQLDKAQLPN